MYYDFYYLSNFSKLLFISWKGKTIYLSLMFQKWKLSIQCVNAGKKFLQKKPKKEYKRILFSILKHGISWNAIVFRNLFMAFLAPLHAMEYKRECYNIVVHIPKLVVVPLHCCIMVKASTRFFPHSAHLRHRK